MIEHTQCLWYVFDIVPGNLADNVHELNKQQCSFRERKMSNNSFHYRQKHCSLFGGGMCGSFLRINSIQHPNIAFVITSTVTSLM